MCDRCGHTPLEHSAGPCHQRSAAGVGCDCGGWAEIVTGGDDAATQPAPSGDPIDTDEMVAEARRQAALGAIMPDLADRLIDEVDRLRAVEVAARAVRDETWGGIPHEDLATTPAWRSLLDALKVHRD